MEEIKEGYTRVSEIVGQWNHLAHIPKHIIENKAQIGTEVHDQICAMVNGIYLETPEEAQKYLGSFLGWWNEVRNNIEILETEKRFYCDIYKITGKVDAIVSTGNKLIVLDYKTSSQPNEKLWALQGGFYYYLAREHCYDVEDCVWFLHCQKDGSPAEVIPIQITPEIWEVCESALKTFHYLKD